MVPLDPLGINIHLYVEKDTQKTPLVQRLTTSMLHKLLLPVDLKAVLVIRVDLKWSIGLR